MDIVSPGDRIRSGTDETVRRGADCPDEYRLSCLVDGELERGDRTRLRTHLANCDHCLRVVTFLSRMADAGPPGSLPADLQVAAQELRFSPTSAPGSSVVLRWAVAAMVLAVTSVAVWQLEPEPGTGKDSGVRSLVTTGSPSTLVPGSGGRGPEILFPAGGATMPSGDVGILWTQVPTAVSYSVRIVTLDGDIVWETRVFTTETLVPPMEELFPGQTYLVRVSAHLPGGKTLDSEHVRFLTDGSP